MAGTTKITDDSMIWGCFSYHGVGKLIGLSKNETINKKIPFKAIKWPF